jgi:hypothetical protein
VWVVGKRLLFSYGVGLNQNGLKIPANTPRPAGTPLKDTPRATHLKTVLPPAVIIELSITIMVYKFPNLSREEVTQMLEIANSLCETRFYQDVLEEGR